MKSIQEDEIRNEAVYNTDTQSAGKTQLAAFSAMTKRTLDSFFSSSTKKAKVEQVETITATVSPPPVLRQNKVQLVSDDLNSVAQTEPAKYTSHATYPFPIRDLPDELSDAIQNLLTASSGKSISNQPHLDLLYYQPLIPQPTATELFRFLRASLPFYRVCYTITKFGKPQQINTPRFTTVFGIDETSKFRLVTSTASPPDPATTNCSTQIVESSNEAKLVPPAKYKCVPRPIPSALSLLLNLTSALTDNTFNFCLVNYYATGTDSISYHSDDERFLGHNPAIASFTLGAKRDFLMKHKPPAKGQPEIDTEPIKFGLGSGDMLLMRGETQSNWLHSIPKRKGGEADKGRINITLRKAMVPAGTENYYRYNVGDGSVYRWDDTKKTMVVWEAAIGNA